jgi:hypothetical protein
MTRRAPPTWHLLAWLALSACSANDDVPAPAIGGLQPDHGVPGIAVTVSGSYLCQQPRADGSDVDPLACAHTGTITFGTTPAVVVSYSDTSASIEVPPLVAGAVDVGVSVAGRSSNRVRFVVE